MKPQFFRTDSGEELVILARRDYDLLLARLGDEEAEIRILDARAKEMERKIAAGEESYLPEWLSAAILRGENVFKASRLRSGKSAGQVAAAAAIPERRVLDLSEAGGRGRARASVPRSRRRPHLASDGLSCSLRPLRGGKLLREVTHQARQRVRGRLAEAADRGVAHHIRELAEKRGVPLSPFHQHPRLLRADPAGEHWPQDSSSKGASG
jgi:hypothetical protein